MDDLNIEFKGSGGPPHGSRVGPVDVEALFGLEHQAVEVDHSLLENPDSIGTGSSFCPWDFDA